MVEKKRGFAAMDPARVREISSMGGRIAHLRGTGHQFTSEEAREAGRKGGQRKRDYANPKAGQPLPALLKKG